MSGYEYHYSNEENFCDGQKFVASGERTLKANLKVQKYKTLNWYKPFEVAKAV